MVLLREHVPGDRLVREASSSWGLKGRGVTLAEGAWEELPGRVQREPGMGAGAAVRSGRRTCRRAASGAPERGGGGGCRRGPAGLNRA